MKLIFATHNQHKLKEVKSLIPQEIELLSLDDISINEEIPETADTMNGNALLKAGFIRQRLGLDCFADDSGLEVEALNGEPGVYSARYAGLQKNDQDNMDKLLLNLKGVQNRRAQFRTVIALILEGREYFFEGIVKGHIIEQKRGDQGFGYDPIFVPEGSQHTFAELGMAEKNNISHRAIAFRKLIEFLNAFVSQQKNA